MKTLKLDASFASRRLDEALFSLGDFLSRSKAKEAIDKGLVYVNGKKGKPALRLEEGDELSYELPESEPSDLIKEDIPLDVIYEDEAILVINKPAGLVVHPGAGHSSGTLVNGLLYRNEDIEKEESSLRPGIVHRIDKDTSGLLAVAKTEEAMLGLQEQLKDHSMHREYLALVSGIIKEDDGKIIAPLGRDKESRVKFKVDLKGKEAITFFSVKERFLRSKATLVDCRLLTGRTHQIRVHMEYIGHPVVGDPLYGKGNRVLYDKGQLLHAYRLSFLHPITKKSLSFEAPLPPYFLEVLKKLS